jgi:hypothetical protein
MKDPVGTRRDVLENLYLFCQEGLEMPVHEKPHKQMCDHWQNPDKLFKLTLVPRGCWKTSIGSTAKPLWKVLRAMYLFGNPSYRSLIDSVTVRLSKYLIDSIARYCQNGSNLKKLFGPLYSAGGDTAEGLTLAFNMNRSGGIKEPNFLASGIRAAKTGLHFEEINCDDLVTKDNYRTPEGRELVWDHYRLMYGILESDEHGRETEVNITGTRYHDDDLYGRILKDEDEIELEGGEREFATLIAPAINEATGELFFPDVLTVEELDRRKRKMGSLYWAQFMLDPNKAGAPFQKDWLHYGPRHEFPKLNMRRMTVDPAIKEDQTSRGDYTCMGVGGWSKFGKPYLIDVSLRKDLNITKFLDLFFLMASRWDPEQIIIEEQSGQLLKPIIHREMLERNMFFPIEFVKATRLDGKMTRWTKVQAVAQNGGIFLAEEIPAETRLELEYQFERAPFGRNDDFLDMLELQMTHLEFTAGESQDSPNSVSPISGSLAPDSPFLTLEQIYPRLREMRDKAKEELTDYAARSPENEDERLLVAGALKWR